MQKLYSIAADAVLLTHACIVLFIVGGLLLTWLGRFLHWPFVRNFHFRALHLAAIAFVAAQSLGGFVCPLTTLENSLRVKAGVGARYNEGCISYWVHRFLFYDADEKVFAAIYLAFFGLVIASFIWIRPRSPKWWRKRHASGPVRQ